MQNSPTQEQTIETLRAGDSSLEVYSDRMVFSANRYETFSAKSNPVDLPANDAPEESEDDQA